MRRIFSVFAILAAISLGSCVERISQSTEIPTQLTCDASPEFALRYYVEAGYYFENAGHLVIAHEIHCLRENGNVNQSNQNFPQ